MSAGSERGGIVQTLRQLKFVMNKNADADMATALAFEAMNEVITSAVNWDPATPRIPDTEPGKGLEAFAKKNELWNNRRKLARKFWADRRCCCHHCEISAPAAPAPLW